MINEAYWGKKSSVFPIEWGRLDANPERGAEELSKELGAKGKFAVIFSDDGQPVACSGVLPYRGNNWVNEVASKTDEERAKGWSSSTDKDLKLGDEGIDDWEVCCFCVHPSQRGQGLSPQLVTSLVECIRPMGGKRLFTMYAIEETGPFWTKLGFETVPGAGGMMPKGFKPYPDREALKADIDFAMGVMTV